MKILKIKSPRKVLQPEFINFSLQNQNEFVIKEESKLKIIETKEPEISTSQNIVYQFEEKKEPFEDNIIETNAEAADLLHNIEKREFPNIDLPYRVLGVAYTMNCQNFNSVYKKWTYCNVKDYCYSNK